MKKIIFALVMFLVFSACGVSHRITPLPGNRYEIQVTGENLFGIPLTSNQIWLERKAREICPDYEIKGSDSVTSFWRGTTMNSWIIECSK